MVLSLVSRSNTYPDADVGFGVTWWHIDLQDLCFGAVCGISRVPWTLLNWSKVAVCVAFVSVCVSACTCGNKAQDWTPPCGLFYEIPTASERQGETKSKPKAPSFCKMISKWKTMTKLSRTHVYWYNESDWGWCLGFAAVLWVIICSHSTRLPVQVRESGWEAINQ